MHPILYQHGDFVLGAYGPVYLLAFLCSIGSMAWLGYRRAGTSYWRMVDYGFQMAIAGEIGARVLFVIVEWQRFVAGDVSMREFLVGGRVVLGGVIAGGTYAWWVFRRNRLPVMATLDAAFTGTSSGMAIGRLGCLLGGCCYGAPTDLAWGMTFTDPTAARWNGTPLGVPLHPTQLLQAALGFALFFLLVAMIRRGVADGLPTGWFFLLNGAIRFGVEFLRGDPRGGFAGLATSQWIGIAMALGGGAFVVYRLRRARGGG